MSTYYVSDFDGKRNKDDATPNPAEVEAAPVEDWTVDDWEAKVVTAEKPKTPAKKTAKAQTK